MSRNIDCILYEAEKQVEMRGLPSSSHLFRAECKIKSIFETLYMYRFYPADFNRLQNGIKTKKSRNSSAFNAFAGNVSFMTSQYQHRQDTKRKGRNVTIKAIYV